MVGFIALLLTSITITSANAASQPGDDAQIVVTILGSGGGPPANLRQFGPSVLIQAGNEKFLFDCGRGALLRLNQAGVPYSEVDKVFLTHLHSDHVIGIPDLWLAGWSLGRRNEPLRVWGPEGTESMMRHIRDAFEFDVHIRRDVDEKLAPEGVRVLAHDIDTGVVYQEGKVTVTAFYVDHRPIQPAFGYRLDYGERSVTLSGDTRFSQNLIKHAMGTDLLIHEAVVPSVSRRRLSPTYSADTIERILEHHATAEEAGTVFAAVKPRLAVYSHVRNDPEYAEALISDTRKTYSGPVHVGRDLMKIEVGAEITVVWPGN